MKSQENPQKFPKHGKRATDFGNYKTKQWQYY